MRRTKGRRFNRLFTALTVLCLVASMGACSDDQGGGSGNNGNNNGGQDAATDIHDDAFDSGSDAGSDASDAQSDGSDAETQTSSLRLTIFDIDGAPIDSASVTLATPGATSNTPATGLDIITARDRRRR